MPLDSILKTVEKSVPGDVLKIALDKNLAGEWSYSITVLTPQGYYRDVSVDAGSNQNNRYQGALMRALVVEDEAKIAAEIAATLSQAGYVVESASDGEKAWLLGETEDYDGIILDLGLPRFDGLSVVRNLRAAGVTDADPDPDRAGLLD